MRFQAALMALLAAEGLLQHPNTEAKKQSPCEERRATNKRPLLQKIQQQQARRPLWDDASFAGEELSPIKQGKDNDNDSPREPDVGILSYGGPNQDRFLQQAPTAAPTRENICELLAQEASYYEEYELCQVDGFENGSTVGSLACAFPICEECNVDTNLCAYCGTTDIDYTCNQDGSANIQYCTNVDCYAADTLCAQSFCFSASYDADGELLPEEYLVTVEGQSCTMDSLVSFCPNDPDVYDTTISCPGLFPVETCNDDDLNLFSPASCAAPFAVAGVTGQGGCVDIQTSLAPAAPIPPPLSPGPTLSPTLNIAATDPPTLSPTIMNVTTTAEPTQGPTVNVTTTEPTTSPTTNVTATEPTTSPTTNVTATEPTTSPTTNVTATETSLGLTNLALQGDDVDVEALETTMETYLTEALLETYDNLQSVNLTLVEDERLRRWLQMVTTYVFSGVATFQGEAPPADQVQESQETALADTAAVQAAVTANPSLGESITVQNIAVGNVTVTTQAPSMSPVSPPGTNQPTQSPVSPPTPTPPATIEPTVFPTTSAAAYENKPLAIAVTGAWFALLLFAQW